MDRIAELERKLENILRLGTVAEVEGTRCRVQLGALLTGWLPWLTQRAGNDRTWWPVSVGEQVMVVSPGGDPACGIVLAGLYCSAHPTPEQNHDKRQVAFVDGTTLTYDVDAHSLAIDIPEAGMLNITVNGPVTVTAPKIDLGEGAALEPSVLGDKLAAWITSELKLWLDTHQHIGNLGSPTSAPVAPFQPGTGASGGAVYSTKNRNQ